jgi:hypothetical protein
LDAYSVCALEYPAARYSGHIPYGFPLYVRVVNGTDLIAGLLLIAATVASWWRLPRAYSIYLG